MTQASHLTPGDNILIDGVDVVLDTVTLCDKRHTVLGGLREDGGGWYGQVPVASEVQVVAPAKKVAPKSHTHARTSVVVNGNEYSSIKSAADTMKVSVSKIRKQIRQQGVAHAS